MKQEEEKKMASALLAEEPETALVHPDEAPLREQNSYEGSTVLGEREVDAGALGEDGVSLLDYAYLLDHQKKMGDEEGNGSVTLAGGAVEGDAGVLEPWPLEIERGGREIAALLLAERRQSGRRAFLFVGPSGGEGTTSLVRATAEALARADHTVLLVDTDLRKNHPGRRYGVDPENGLVDLQFGRCNADEAVRSTPLPGLRYLPPGILRSGEEVSDVHLPDLLAGWRRNVEFLLVDAPPALDNPLAGLWAPLVDAAVVIVRAHRTRRHALAALLEELRRRECAVAGVVLNQRDFPLPDWLYRLL